MCLGMVCLIDGGKFKIFIIYVVVLNMFWCSLELIVYCCIDVVLNFVVVKGFYFVVFFLLGSGIGGFILLFSLEVMICVIEINLYSKIFDIKIIIYRKGDVV